MDIEQAVTEITRNPAWSASAARCCLRAKFRCEYCGLDFLESPVSYKQIQFDHIVPKHLGGSDAEENLATVCRTCNMDWKSRWDPRTRTSPEPTRDELIAVCRQHIRDRCDEFDPELVRLGAILGAVQRRFRIRRQWTGRGVTEGAFLTVARHEGVDSIPGAA